MSASSGRRARPLALPALVLVITARSAYAGPGACEYSEGEEDWAPYVFWKRLPNGSRTSVEAESDASGLCVFPGASCESGDFECCKLSPVEQRATTIGTMVNTWVCVCVLVLPRLLTRMSKRCRGQSAAGGGSVGAPPAPGAGSPRCWGMAAFIVGIGLSVAVMVTVAQLAQGKLSVPMRNAMVASLAVLEPIREVFQFLEDAVTVQINFALGAKAWGTVRLVLRVGVIGSVVLGTLAASLVTGLSYWTAAIQYLLVPFSLAPSVADCPLVPSPEQVVETARPYLLLMAWKWPFQFTNMALSGFLLGTGHLASLGLLLTLENLITLVGVLAFFTRDPSLEVLGWMSFAGSAFATVFMLVVLLSQRELREKYIFGTSSDSEERQGEGADEGEGAAAPEQPTVQPGRQSFDAKAKAGVLDASWSTIIRDGFLAMVLDLAVQLPLTIGIYVAGASFGIGPMYQISSLQAAFPQYGMQWIVGLTIAFRIKGTRLVGAMDYTAFKDLFVSIVRFGSVLAIVAAATVVPFRASLSFKLAEQACEYASDTRCLPIYASIFGGGAARNQALQGWPMVTFVVALLSTCLFRLFKAGLYACFEWGFMAKAGSAALVLVFAPAMALACLPPLRSPAAVLAAMYLPQLALAVAFAARIARNIHKMLAGGELASEPSDSEVESSSSGRSDAESESSSA